MGEHAINGVIKDANTCQTALLFLPRMTEECVIHLQLRA